MSDESINHHVHSHYVLVKVDGPTVVQTTTNMARVRRALHALTNPDGSPMHFSDVVLRCDRPVLTHPDGGTFPSNYDLVRSVVSEMTPSRILLARGIHSVHAPLSLADDQPVAFIHRND